MAAGSALLTLSDTTVKWVSASLSVGQILFIRSLFLILFIYIFIGISHLRNAHSGTSLHIGNWRAQSLRTLMMILSTFGFVAGLSLLPLADAIAIAFASPLFLTILASLILGEQVGWRRWSAVFIGFIGILIILRPSGESFNWAALLPLGAGLAAAIRDIITRRISATESSLATLHFATIAVMFTGLATAPLGWSPLPVEALGLLALAGLFAGGAHFLLIETFRWAEASLVAPFKYSTLLWGVLFGFLLWGEIPEREVIIGALLLVVSGLYILRRETRRA